MSARPAKTAIHSGRPVNGRVAGVPTRPRAFVARRRPLIGLFFAGCVRVACAPSTPLDCAAAVAAGVPAGVIAGVAALFVAAFALFVAAFVPQFAPLGVNVVDVDDDVSWDDFSPLCLPCEPALPWSLALPCLFA